MREKICLKCKIIKCVSEFSFKHKAKGKLHPYCKTCFSFLRREAYLNNKEYYKTKTTLRKKAVIEENKQKLIVYLSSKLCVDCSESDIRVLEFDHVRGEKTRGVSQMISRGCSWKTIEKEIAKCDIRCCNCHRRKTIESLGWYRNQKTT